MIRGQSESDFPDVDQMLQEADAPKSVLGYYGPDPAREPESDLLPCIDSRGGLLSSAVWRRWRVAWVNRSTAVETVRR